MVFKNSYEVIEAIEVKKRNGIDLKSFKAFMDSLDNPQWKLKCIHVGGTNGKGSTTNVMRSILQKAGYKVGTFTSPYLERHHDRIRINDVFIEDEVITQYANVYYEEWLKFDLSMFEIDMFIAVKYFLDHQVDIAIFEVGLGGDQDATNIVDPMVSVITNIGLDHMEFLGNTYASIATAKAGIIKKNRALVTSEKREECLTIFKNKCKEMNVKMLECGEIENIIVDKELAFDYKGFHVKQNTLAKYQALNTALAIETMLYLRNHDLVDISDEDILKGIYDAKWKGRFEVIQKHPLVIIDGAHNEEGIKALVDSCQNYDNIRILFSALVDKPYDKMLDALLSLTEDVTVCEFPFVRAASAETISKDHDVRIIKDYKEAIHALMDEAHTLLICGSLYFISDVRNYFFEKGESTLK
ncbi:dihydrofolate synthase/folylpolyglutamate synthase [Breznakia sp. PF5-3]|uniref:bifunctional folylpolyglutamate synthase/dihydrofolate synthase n=1 Tax=unclassified Breznakia TaxID=2623764 RepID=UPI00240583A6|nr:MULTISPECIES: folylpolyglutamate synthase/dihydrofolate synthase family protein [unclassified Breznakia]MDF9824572.1 dihydrofolate synthase/folylpolyglutamate synthase [Breznakia sp. PM6-1]MDF9835462.1 dihydrofolate synthase/folylpolyglutamate synthase [Breznakia sp. PF5-3]MDF9837872.1 dihydrofolate synthase/folylpolyglutamate synthase [Breznakia sp. PFB2-8]MDF9859835.1 dihydrofolate synthase/folylpolyglutamate synthase [Breznakia sp. PH5-24]